MSRYGDFSGFTSVLSFRICLFSFFSLLVALFPNVTWKNALVDSNLIWNVNKSSSSTTHQPTSTFTSTSTTTSSTTTTITTITSTLISTTSSSQKRRTTDSIDYFQWNQREDIFQFRSFLHRWSTKRKKNIENDSDGSTIDSASKENTCC